MLQTPDFTPMPASLTLAWQDTPRGVLGGDSGNATESQPAGQDGAAAQPTSPFGGFMMPLVFGLALFMIFSMMTSGRRQKKERERLMSSLGKHDKVQTSAGIIGTIVELKDESVLLRVDEASNTRIRFARSAIMQVLHSAGKAPSEEEIEEEAINVA